MVNYLPFIDCSHAAAMLNEELLDRTPTQQNRPPVLVNQNWPKHKSQKMSNSTSTDVIFYRGMAIKKKENRKYIIRYCEKINFDTLFDIAVNIKNRKISIEYQ